MTGNPYELASSITAQPSVVQHRPATARPVGVSILAVLYCIGVCPLIGGQFVMFAKLQAMAESLYAVGIPLVLLIMDAMCLAVLTNASGVRM